MKALNDERKAQVQKQVRLRSRRSPLAQARPGAPVLPRGPAGATVDTPPGARGGQACASSRAARVLSEAVLRDASEGPR